MKAVNLLPSDARGSGGSLSDLGVGTTAVFAALGLGLALVVAYVVLANGVTNRKHQLADVQQQSAVAEKQVAALKPYADLEQLRESLLGRVRSLAGGRYDWPTMLSRLARALPKDAVLTSLDGSPAASGGATTPTPTPATSTPTSPSSPAAPAAPAAGPSVSLAGCTPSHEAVARVIDRLRAVDGVSSVALQSSTITQGASDSGSGGCPGAEQFKLTVQLEAPAAPAAPAATSPATPTTPSPTPAPASPQASTGATPGGTS